VIKNTSAFYLQTKMPMMYMDAIAATIKLCKPSSRTVKYVLHYNLAAMSFTPTEIAAESKTHFLNLRLL
jgi:hypothetical protein